MGPLTALLLILVAALVAVWLVVQLERRLRRPGLASGAASVLMLVGAANSFSEGNRLLPALFLIQAAAFAYLAWWRHQHGANPPATPPRR